MKLLALFLTTFFCLFAFIQATIVDLTDENFSDLIQKEDEWLIDFYADWCGYCKRIEPKFQAADRLLRMSDYTHVKLGKVNVETNPGLSARFFISRLPTIVHVKDHQVRLVKNTQRENDIVSFVTLEEWREVDPQSGFIAPFSLFGKLVGFAGKTVKRLSSHSPWTLIGVMTGALIFAFSLPVLLGKKSEEQEGNSKKVDTENETTTTTTTTEKKQVKSPLRERRSKRID